ncbi:MAG: hypothetical protein QG671_2173, partial [Actinomycetota bacterium]|nr:hypothetical protein [Actinomycetota bacterium]
MTDTPSISNVGEYLSAHYLAEVLPGVLRKGRVPEWQKAEKAHAARTVDGLPVSPRAGLRDLGRAYFAAKTDVLDLVPGTPELAEAVHALHLRVLTALGFRAEPGDLDRVRSDHPHTVPVLHHEPGIVAIEGGWATDPDACLDPGDPEDAGAPVGAGRLPEPVILRGAQGKEEITDVRHLVAHLFATVDPPSYVLVLTGGVITLADRTAWGEGRRLSVSLESLYGRNDSAEIDIAAHLLHAETLRPPTAGGAPALAGIVDGSRQHAVGVSAELREGLRTSVELVANEVLTRLREQGLNAEQTDDPKALGARLRKESLRYLYRILFLLYAEARPDLGVLPVDAPEYTAGYGMGRLGDLVAKPLGPNSGAGFHLYESLDLLFRLVDQGHDGVRG